MRMHVIKHVDFEGPELIGDWALERGFGLTESLAITEEYPPPSEVDFLVVMGGPMAADDHASNPWLVTEKQYLSAAIDHGCRLLGVCLGAQLLAEATGGVIRRNRCPEIGFFPVSRTPGTGGVGALSVFPDQLVVGHWHADTFDPPPGVPSALASAVTPSQAFSLRGGRVVAMQFHLEWTREAVKKLIDAAGDALSHGGPHVWGASALIDGIERYQPRCREVLWALLDGMMIAGEEGR